jgi:hypothetical protein
MNSNKSEYSQPAHSVYRRALDALNRAGFPFLIGGAFALNFYTGVHRDTKDIDVFILPHDYERGLQILSDAGFLVSRSFPHWLGKASYGEYQIDIIFSSGNAIGKVDSLWFKHAEQGEVLGTRVQFCPVEEMIWSKAYIMERERHDGADIMHLLLFRNEMLDWQRLVERFGSHWRLLLSYLVLFGFVYPSERSKVPNVIMKTLLERLNADMRRPPDAGKICQGTLLSRQQYLPDVEQWGYLDARLRPLGGMTEEEISLWSYPEDNR